MPKPIIFLAFANDREDNARYLRNLSVEANEIVSILRQAEVAGLCEVILRQNIGIEQIVQTFQDSRYRDRIAIFHYGGHADGYQLLLNTAAGNQIAYGGGLVSFLAGQKGLQLVFFNGCSTQQQSEELSQAGIPAVIGTANAINDKIATDLAIGFYGGLGEGHTLARAWAEAIDKIKIENDTENLRGLYRKEKDKEQDFDRFPWDMYVGIGKEKVREWSLPDAAENPLFGLPEIPARFSDLPQEPFRFLERYKAAHARVFFGRSYAIRELYDKIKHKQSAAVILFYGQSGAGKSSLLEAGLLPRLENEYQVIYLRRNPQKGLIGTLKEALLIGEKDKEENLTWISEIEKLLQKENIQEVPKQQFTQLLNQYKNPTPSLSLAEAWQQKEANQKPLILILDQAEELFTQKGDKSEEIEQERNVELVNFLAELEAIFVNTAHKPKGKLILSYRKEFQAEFEEAFKSQGLPKERVFLQRLSRRDIIEIFREIGTLQANYKLQIENGLAELIADELSQDLDSPVAPVLQILLSKLWKEAAKNEADDKVFDRKLYQKLKSKGILLSDFFNEQMHKIQAEFVELDRLGVSLDLLHVHTTPIGTAGSKTVEELRQIYSAQAEKLKQLQALKEKFTQLHLLTAPQNELTTLAHDSLAPLVQNAFRQSEKIVPRALRILENKVSESAYQPDNFLAEDELEIVEQAANGMRIWNTKEQKLIERSREKKAELEAERKKAKRNKQLLRVGLIAFTLLASFMWYKTNKEAKASKLATQALQMESIDPTQALHLAEKAYQIWETPNNLQIFNGILSKHQFYQQNFEGHTSRVVDVAFSPDSKYILSASQDSTARLWDLEGKLLQTFKHPTFVRTAYFSNNNTIRTTGADSLIYIWDRAGKLIGKQIETILYAEKIIFDFPIDSALQQKLSDEKISNYAFSSDRKQLIVGFYYPKNVAELYDVQSGTLLKTFEGHQDDVSAVAFSPDGKYVLTGSYDKTLKLWNLQGREEFKTALLQRPISVAYGNEKVWIGTDGLLYGFDKDGKLTDSLTLSKSEIRALVFSENRLFAGGLDSTLRILDLTSKKVQAFPKVQGEINGISLSPDRKKIAVSADNSLFIFDEKGKILDSLKGHHNYIFSLSFSPDDTYLVSASYDSTAILWDTKNGKKAQVFKQNEVFSAAVFADNQTLLLGDWSGKLHKINVATKQQESFPLAKNFINQIVLTPNKQQIVVASEDGNAYLCNLDGEVLHTFVGHTDAVIGLAVSPDGKYIYSIGSDYTLIKWNVNPFEYLNSGRVWKGKF